MCEKSWRERRPGFRDFLLRVSGLAIKVPIFCSPEGGIWRRPGHFFFVPAGDFFCRGFPFFSRKNLGFFVALRRTLRDTHGQDRIFRPRFFTKFQFFLGKFPIFFCPGRPFFCPWGAIFLSRRRQDLWPALPGISSKFETTWAKRSKGSENHDMNKWWKWVYAIFIATPGRGHYGVLMGNWYFWPRDFHQKYVFCTIFSWNFENKIKINM